MAVEVRNKEYIFQQEEDSDDSDDDGAFIEPKGKAMRAGVIGRTIGRNEDAWVPATNALSDDDDDQELPLEFPFLFNPLHDMEAILWIGTYFVSNKDVECTMKPGAGELPSKLLEALGVRAVRLDNQSVLAEKLFWTRIAREALLRRRNMFKKNVTVLHPATRQFWLNLDGIRRILVRKYKEAENSGAPITCDVAQGLHQRFYQRLTAITAISLPYKLKVKVLHPPAIKPAKIAQVSAGPAPPGSSDARPSATSAGHLKRRQTDEPDVTSSPPSSELTPLESDSPAPGPSRKSKRRRNTPPADTSTRVTRSRSDSSVVGNATRARAGKGKEGAKDRSVKGKERA